MQATNDAAIRSLLIPFVRDEHSSQGETLYVEEFALYGGSNRVDLAAFNGLSHGYEIKSDKDTLLRLPEQANAYNAVFERATIVAGRKHALTALNVIPQWWGVVEVKGGFCDKVFLERTRQAMPNPSPDSGAIAALLWRPEALRILANLGLDAGLRSKPMEYLIERLAAEIPADRLSRYVREALRARGDWKSAARLPRDDAKSRLHASRHLLPHSVAVSSD